MSGIPTGITRTLDGRYVEGEEGELVRELTAEETIAFLESSLEAERKNWRTENERCGVLERGRKQLQDEIERRKANEEKLGKQLAASARESEARHEPNVDDLGNDWRDAALSDLARSLRLTLER